MPKVDFNPYEKQWSRLTDDLTPVEFVTFKPGKGYCKADCIFSKRQAEAMGEILFLRFENAQVSWAFIDGEGEVISSNNKRLFANNRTT